MKRNPWRRVTNELVCSFGQQGCGNCKGSGCIGDDESGYTVCSCAALAFRREYGDRVRVVTQRIGNRDVKRLQYREMASV